MSGSGTLPGYHCSKPGILFGSCLDIPVRGAMPIDRDACRNSSATDSAEATLAESKRGPRKSKTDALAALNNQARSSSPCLDDMDIEDKYRNSCDSAP